MDILKKVGKCAGIVLIFNVVFIVFLTLTYMIPVDGKIKENVGNSLYALNGEDRFPIFHDPNGFWFDNGTDMGWINMAVTQTDKPLADAVGMYWKITLDEPPEDQERDYYDLIQALYYPNADNTATMDYSRCGVLMVGILKVLFLVYEISDIRYILYFSVFALTVFLIYKLCTIGQTRLVAPLAVAMAIRLWQMNAACFTTVQDIWIALAAMIAVIYMIQNNTFKDKHIYLFLITGIFAYEMGMLIAPVLTLGMPLALSVVLNKENDRDIKSWIRVLTDSIVWVMGYICSMLFKQILASIVLSDLDGTGTSVMRYWLAPELGIESRIDRIVYCLGGLFSPMRVKLPIMILIIVVMMVFIIKYGYKKINNNLLLLFVGLYPFAWIFIFTRHSQHYWVANILSISVFALLSILSLQIKERK